MTYSSYQLTPVNTDLFDISGIVQTIGIVAGKSLLIDTLRDVFREDREFKYVEDPFGFPKIPEEVGLASDAGLNDSTTTRIFIGSTYRYDVSFYPCISVKNTSSRYVPVSFNQDWLGIVYRKEQLVDAYGNSTFISTPAYNTLVGAWDQTFEVKITSESEIDREELADIVQTILISTKRHELQDAGLFLKTISTSGESEEPRGNNYLYSVSINLETRSEFKVMVPISDVIERIGLYITFGTATGAGSLDINEVFTQKV